MEYGDWPVPSPGYLVMVKPPPQIQPPPASQFAHTRGTSSMGMMQPEERQLKRPKFDKPELVPDDQFLAKHPDSYTIRVSVPNIDDGQVIEIIVQTLSENVASLKEKIAKKLKVRGEDGFLQDNMSLAQCKSRSRRSPNSVFMRTSLVGCMEFKRVMLLEIEATS
ncbi:putative splicing factor 3A subunit 1 [Cardamine amara subsp. amara]|uniref:Splicing factor 3A subunit 1 n=1 Tax=Cardamine amara subsp. amara TaxID=228776 RepID=A0ABD1AWK3_CARAN